jgi:large subunit ribosomal protein L6
MSLNYSFIIKIPAIIQLLFCSNTNRLIFVQKNQILVKKVHLKVLISHKKKLLYISNSVNNTNYHNYSKKRLKKIRYDLLLNIYSFIKKSCFLFYKKILLKGVGYRFILKNKERSILQLLIGFSHSIFIRLPSELGIYLIKPNLLYITSVNYLKLNKIIQTIRKLRITDVYKGKGINFEYEKLFLKEGKKSQ